MKVRGSDVWIRQLHGSTLILPLLPYEREKRPEAWRLCRLSLARLGEAAVTSLVAKVVAALRRSTRRYRRVAATS